MTGWYGGAGAGGGGCCLPYNRRITMLIVLWVSFVLLYFTQIVIIVVFEEWIVSFPNATGDVEIIGILNRCNYADEYWTCKMMSVSRIFTWDFDTAVPPILLLLSMLFAALALTLMLFACVIRLGNVVAASGVFVSMSGACLGALAVIFPLTWDEVPMKNCLLMRYSLADCHIGWTYVLAVFASLDSFKILLLSLYLAAKCPATGDIREYSDVSDCVPMIELKSSSQFSDTTLPSSFVFKDTTAAIRASEAY